MPKSEQELALNQLINDYFSDPKRLLWLKAGDILMREGEYNSRLYFVRSGNLSGFVENEYGDKEEVLTARVNNLVGVYSFFSKTLSSLATIEAITDCELAFIDIHTKSLSDSLCIEKDFIPFAVKDLMNRQKRLIEMSHEKQQVLKKLLENQNLASLGQIAAGIAHELNNSISVLAHNSGWLTEQLTARIANPFEAAIFETGLIKGRFLSSREARMQKKELLKKYDSINEEVATQLAQMGLSESMLIKILAMSEQKLKHIFTTWEMGAALHDMQIAAEQSAHVVKSVKALGNQNRNRQPGVDLNDTIQNALTLLRHKTRNVSVQLHFNPLPAISANTGEFIQVWTNLIKNACEAMLDSAIEEPRLTIKSELLMGQLRIKISDNGPGIPKEIFSTIYQPNVTTKVSGLSFGLGLGLTIIKRIINEYDGRIDVQSSSNGTSFTIYIPVGGNNE